MLPFLKRYTAILPILAIIVLIVGALAYFSGFLGILFNQPVVYTTPLAVTANVPVTPDGVVANLDPAILIYLRSGRPSYGIAPLAVMGANIPPIGAYLPRTGSTQFALAAPTALPTMLPYPTSPPLPFPTIPGYVVPEVNPLAAEDVFPTSMPLNMECAPSGYPVNGILTQNYYYYHSGADFGVDVGTPVLATHTGQVTFADWSAVGYGYLVILQSGQFITYYAHNSSFNVTVGQYVTKGSILAWSGSTGNSSGPHVHYETRIDDVPVDPLTFDSRGYASC